MKSMLRFVLRKMGSNRLLTAGTFIGLVVAVAFTVSIPIYTNGAVARLVSWQMQNYSGGLPVGSLLVRYQPRGMAIQNEMKQWEDLNRYVQGEIPRLLSLSVESQVKTLAVRAGQIYPEDSGQAGASRRRQMVLQASSGLKEHVKVTIGRFYDSDKDRESVEAVIPEEAMYRYDIHVGDRYLSPLPGIDRPITINIVGVVAPTNEKEAYWYQGDESISNRLFVDELFFQTELQGKSEPPLAYSEWFYSFDLSKLQASDLTGLQSTLVDMDKTVYQMLAGSKVEVSFQPFLQSLLANIRKLEGLMLSLSIPLLGIIMFYIVNNSIQSLTRQRQDLAVLSSRGGSVRKLGLLFIIEAGLLGIGAILVGFPLGRLMAVLIGSSNGYLQFVNRAALPVRFTETALLYGLGAVVLSLLAVVLPTLYYTRLTIVNFQQEKIRMDKSPFWQRWYLDAGLLVLSMTGWYLFREYNLLSLHLLEQTASMNPLLFFIPALFIFS